MDSRLMIRLSMENASIVGELINFFVKNCNLIFIRNFMLVGFHLMDFASGLSFRGFLSWVWAVYIL